MPPLKKVLVAAGKSSDARTSDEPTKAVDDAKVISNGTEMFDAPIASNDYAE